MKNRKRSRRNGHCGFWLALLFWSMVCIVIAQTIAHFLFHGAQNAPGWFKIAAVALNPVTIVYSLCLAMICATIIFLAEIQASRINLAFWQYDWEKVLGVPKWLAVRTLFGVSGVCSAMLLTFAWRSGNVTIDNLTILTCLATTAIAVISTALQVVAVAQLSPEPATLGNERF